MGTGTRHNTQGHWFPEFVVVDPRGWVPPTAAGATRGAEDRLQQLHGSLGRGLGHATLMTPTRLWQPHTRRRWHKKIVKLPVAIGTVQKEKFTFQE